MEAACHQNVQLHILTCRPAAAELGARIEVLHVKVEDMAATVEQVDVLVSEPMGTLLVNERMLETYLYARDRFLKPGGLMFPVRPSEQATCSIHATHAHAHARTPAPPARDTCQPSD